MTAQGTETHDQDLVLRSFGARIQFGVTTNPVDIQVVRDIETALNTELRSMCNRALDSMAAHSLSSAFATLQPVRFSASRAAFSLWNKFIRAMHGALEGFRAGWNDWDVDY